MQIFQSRVPKFCPLMLHYAALNLEIPIKDIEILITTCATFMLLYENKGNYREEISKKLDELKTELFDEINKTNIEESLTAFQRINSAMNELAKADSQMEARRIEIIRQIVSKQHTNLKIAPIHIAAMKNNIPLINLLVSYGADINVEDKNWRTPLDQQ